MSSESATDPVESALASLSDASDSISQMNSKYAPIYAAMADQLGDFLEADRDGQIGEAEQMLNQLRTAWESQNSEESE